MNWPCASVCTAVAACTAVAVRVQRRSVSTARTVTPGIGTLLLSSTTPVIVVFAGSPGARPDAVKAAGKPWFDGNVAVDEVVGVAFLHAERQRRRDAAVGVGDRP